MDLGPIDVNIEGGLTYPFPPLISVQQHFARQSLDSIATTIHQQLEQIPAQQIDGKSIAITVGSRGITGLVDIIRALIEGLRMKGGDPFIVPSMGSHGGATAVGQLAVLKGYGITESSMAAPIRSSMDVVEVGQYADGTPLYTDRLAFEADGIVLANKIKPHADFKAHYESGLVKMLTIGLAKHKGAVALHDHGFAAFHEVLPAAAEILLDKLPVLFGLAILENAFDELMHLEIIPAADIMMREKALLDVAKQSIGRLLFDEIDVLIIDEIGKNISGEGMDPNVTGRPGSDLPGFPAPAIQKILALDITPESHGNGVGIGSADLTTRGCVEKIDLGAMYTNAITATVLNPAKLPMVLNNDHDALCVALKTCNRITPENVKIVRIRNTLDVHQLWVSPALLEFVNAADNLSATGGAQAMCFDKTGRLLPQPVANE